MIDLEINEITVLKKRVKVFIGQVFFTKGNSKKMQAYLYSICRHFDDIIDKNREDQTTYLKRSIKEIKNNKNNKVNIFLQKNKINISDFRLI